MDIVLLAIGVKDYFPQPSAVMAGLVPAIHAFAATSKAWMPGT
jgi:hypothetical protein